ncbi:MAG: M15 family metallopeptidase [Bacteroidales bacterium]|nr:M15 family metallopeptidase [Bacteroidales bacterium]
MSVKFTGSFLLAMLLFSCQEKNYKSYEYELGVISNPRIYKMLAEDSPEKQMVDLKELIPGIVLDIRYATKNNFTGNRIYLLEKAYLRLPAAKALKRIEAKLNKQGLGLKIFDAYRPYAATVKFYEVYPDTNFVAAPWKGSKHNRGCAVDLTIIDLKTGKELPMPTPFDDFTEKAAHSYTDLPKNIINNRKLLRDIMTQNGFTSIPNEWWHYDFVGWENYELLDISFSDLK